MVNWELFLPEVLPEVSGCPDILAINAIRNAAIKLCRKSGIWQEDLDDLTVSSGDPLVEMDPPSQGVVMQVVEVRLSDFELKPTAEAELRNKNLLWKDQTGGPLSYFLLNPTTIRLYPEPEAADTLTVTAFIKPSLASYEGPDFLYEDYREAIAAGAKAELMAMPSKDWYRPDHVAMMRADFNAGVNEARIKRNKSFTTKSQRVRRRRFA